MQENRPARILLVINHAGFFLSHRLPIALAAQSAGYDVTIATPKSKHVGRIQAAGLAWREIRLSRSGRNPFSELRSVASLFKTYRDVAPDLVHHVSSKPVLYGTLVARLLGIRAVVNAISGMGHVFSGDHAPHPLFQRAVAFGYNVALRHPNMRVIFQNVDHERTFIARRWVKPEDAVLIPGSGVDTAVFHPTAPDPERTPAVMFVSRMLYTKGVVQFVEAAKQLRASGLDARFILVGEPDPDNLASVPEAQLRAWAGDGSVEYWGRREDMPSVFGQADVVCLPTFYPEGIPKTLIEAASCGLPIVTTDWPGCREIVRDGENGLLVPVKDTSALAGAIRSLVIDRASRERMGARGRELVVGHYALNMVVQKTLDIYRELLA